MNEVMNICWKSILCNLTVSNIVILVQSSITDGESFLANLATKNFLNQLSTNSNLSLLLSLLHLIYLIVAIATYP